MRLTDDQRRIAVEWWIDKLVNPPVADGGFNFDTFLRVNIIRDITNKATKLTKYHLQTIEFKNLLGALIMYRDETLILHTDYEPLELLRFVAEKAGVPLNLFPIKTAMKFKDGAVYVKMGYGKEFEEIKEKENV